MRCKLRGRGEQNKKKSLEAVGWIYHYFNKTIYLPGLINILQSTFYCRHERV